MQNEKKIVNRISRKGKEKSTKVLVVVLTVLLLSVIGVRALSSYLAEREYQNFIRQEIFTDEIGINILGTYVPNGKGLTHTIVKEESEKTDKQYVLYAVVQSDNSRLPVMRLNGKQSQYLNRYLCTSTTLDLSNVKSEVTTPVEENEKLPTEETKPEEPKEPTINK